MDEDTIMAIRLLVRSYEKEMNVTPLVQCSVCCRLVVKNVRINVPCNIKMGV